MLKTLVINGMPKSRPYINNMTEANGYKNENTLLQCIWNKRDKESGNKWAVKQQKCYKENYSAPL